MAEVKTKTDFLRMNFYKALKGTTDDKIKYLYNYDTYLGSYRTYEKIYDKLFNSITNEKEKYQFLFGTVKSKTYHYLADEYLGKFSPNDINVIQNIIDSHLIKDTTSFFKVTVQLNKQQAFELLKANLHNFGRITSYDIKQIIKLSSEVLNSFDETLEFYEQICNNCPPNTFRNYNNNPFVLALMNFFNGNAFKRGNFEEVKNKIFTAIKNGDMSYDDAVAFVYNSEIHGTFSKDDLSQILTFFEEIAKGYPDNQEKLLALAINKHHFIFKNQDIYADDDIPLRTKGYYSALEGSTDEYEKIINSNKYSSKELCDYIIALVSNSRFNSIDETINKYVIANVNKFSPDEISYMLVSIIKIVSMHEDYYQINQYPLPQYKDKKEIYNLLNKYSKYILKKDNSVVIKAIDDFNSTKDRDFILKNSNLINIDCINIDFSSLNDDKFCEYFFNELGVTTPETREYYYRIASYLLKINGNIFKTLDKKLLDQKYIDMFEVIDKNGEIIYPSLRTIGKFPELQNQILNINPKNLEIFKIMYKEITNVDCDYTVLLKHVIDNVSKYDDLMDDVLKNINNLAPGEQKRIVEYLIFVISKNDSRINPKNFQELLNIESKIKDDVQTALNGNDLLAAKDAILLYRFGLSLKESESYVKRYASNLNISMDELDIGSIEIINLLNEIKQIINCQDFMQLEQFLKLDDYTLDFKDASMFEAKIRRMYAKVLNRSLTSVNMMQKSADDYNTGVDIYFAFDEKRPEFYMLLTALGAYNNKYVKPDNYKKDWYRSSDMVHAFCTSLINSEMMGTARLKYACLGFLGIPNESLLLAAPFDIMSSGANTQMDTALAIPDERVKFLMPNLFIDYTRHTHNEIVLDRFVKNNKLAPSFSILMLEQFDPEQIRRWAQYKYTESEKEEYELYVNAVQAAKDFGIPIVVVERGKIRKYQQSEIQKMLEEFKKNHSPQLLDKMLTKFENCRAGSRTYWNNEGFTKKDINTLLNDVFKEIETLSLNGDAKAMECIEAFETWLLRETNEKVGRKWEKITERELGFSPKVAMATLKRLSSSENIKNNSTWDNVLGIIMNKELNNKTLIDSLDNLMANKFGIMANQLGLESSTFDSAKVNTNLKQLKPFLESALDDEDFIKTYTDSNSRVHNLDHIEDVLVFSSLLGAETFGPKSRMMQIIAEAAKYHDCARVTDSKENHALASAKKSYEILKKQNKYSRKELAVIYTLINCHDLPRDTNIKESAVNTFQTVLYNLNTNADPWNKVDARYLDDMGHRDAESLIRAVQILRDADALDRTRFRMESKAFLDLSKISDGAKKYFPLATNIVEFRAIKTLSQWIDSGVITIDDITAAINSLTIKSPIEVMHLVKHRLKHSKVTEVTENNLHK